MFFSAIVVRLVTNSLVPVKVSGHTDTNKLHSQTIFSFFHGPLSLSLSLCIRISAPLGATLVQKRAKHLSFYAETFKAFLWWSWKQFSFLVLRNSSWLMFSVMITWAETERHREALYLTFFQKIYTFPLKISLFCFFCGSMCFIFFPYSNSRPPFLVSYVKYFT